MPKHSNFQNKRQMSSQNTVLCFGLTHLLVI